MRRVYARYANDVLSGHRFVNPLRLFDWLTLLGFELDCPPVYRNYQLPLTRMNAQMIEPGEQDSHEPDPTSIDADAAVAASGSDNDRGRFDISPRELIKARMKTQGGQWLQVLRRGWSLPFGGLLLVSATKQSRSVRPGWLQTDVAAAKDQGHLAPVAYPQIASWRQIDEGPSS